MTIAFERGVVVPAHVVVLFGLAMLLVPLCYSYRWLLGLRGLRGSPADGVPGGVGQNQWQDRWQDEPAQV